MGKVTMIPATISRYTASPINEKTKRKVAAYARVSTDSEEQLTSYEAQISYYTNYINEREDWELVKVYTDEGISGCNTKKREGFKQMIEDALAGKINLIITKSVSRFARNTVDSLTAIRKLKENNIECYFEKENIWTFDGKGELLLTIMSSISQEESRSISENVTWGKRKSMSDGKVSIAYTRFLGYDMDQNGKLVINHEQAKIVRLIFAEFLKGKSFYSIAKELTDKGIKTVTGKDKWCRQTINRILSNEKYKGDALLQKEYTVDYLTKKRNKNAGQLPMYYIEGDHEAIIEPDVFDAVQHEIMKRKSGKSRYSGVSRFSGRIKCGQCGSWFGAKIWHSTSSYRKTVYQCNHKYDGEKCRTPHVTEEEIKELFTERVNAFIGDKVKNNILSICSKICDTAALEEELKKHTEAMKQISEAAEQAVKENAFAAADQEEYRSIYNELMEKYDKENAKYTEVLYKIKTVEARQHHMEEFKKVFEVQKGKLTEFDENLWDVLVDHITVNEDGSKAIELRDGTVI